MKKKTWVSQAVVGTFGQRKEYKVTEADLSRLLPMSERAHFKQVKQSEVGAYLNDQVVNAYLHLMYQASPNYDRIYMANTFLLDSVKSAGDHQWKLSRLLKGRTEEHLQIIIPVGDE
jgi:Ulp1 family protease